MMTRKHNRGFSLLEVVIVVAIIAILAAIGVPRMSRGARGAGDAALRANLAVLRNAVDLYSAEHQGDFPAVLTFDEQLTQYTDLQGATSTSQTGAYIYGPYLRAIPPLPVGAGSGDLGVAAADANGVGWIYNATTGDISANCTNAEVDASGVQYNQY